MLEQRLSVKESRNAGEQQCESNSSPIVWRWHDDSAWDARATIIARAIGDVRRSESDVQDAGLEYILDGRVT